MGSSGEVIKIAAGFAIVTILTILADRWLSDKVAVAVLIVSLVIFGLLSRQEIRALLDWAPANKLATIIGCILVFAIVGLLIGLVISRNASSKTGPTDPAKPHVDGVESFVVSEPRSFINMKRDFYASAPLWVRYLSGYGDTISPVAVALWIDITNNLDESETVKEYSVAINTQQCGWVYLVPIRMRDVSVFFIKPGGIHEAMLLDFGTNGLDYILEKSIPPHGTVSGWFFFDTRVKCNVLNGESIQYRVTASMFSGKALDTVTPFSVLRGDSLTPGSSRANMTGPQFVMPPGHQLTDLSKCHPKFYSDEIKSD
jgi:hypothetical protein